jgi:anti-sigma factor RsiW
MSAEERYLDELLGAYALDAVDDEERRAVEAYLAVNPAAAAEVAEFREVASMLTFSTVTAPDDVWGRIAAELGDEVAPLPSGELAKVLPMSAAPSKRRRSAAILPWAVAAAAALVAVFTFTTIDRGTADDPIAAAFEQALSDSSSRVAVLEAAESDARVKAVVDVDGHGFLDASQLPRLDPSQAYQLWGVIDDKVISLGVFGAEPQIEPFTVEGPVSALAITIEVAGGVVSDGNPDGAYSGALA